MAPIILLLAVGGIAAFALSQRGGSSETPALPPDPRELENIIIIIAGKKANADHFKRGAQMAMALGMPLTAKAIKGEYGLPKNENWVGTNIPVATYIQQTIARRKLDDAKKKVAGVKKGYAAAKALGKDIKGLFS